MTKSKMIFSDPAFYDIFGSLAFIFLIYLGISGLKKEKIKPWVFKVLLTIGILGLIIDSTIVMMRFVL